MINPVNKAAPGRLSTLSIWLLYLVIVFEILFMVSPFALYYYSAYGIPLNALTAYPATAWLTQHILPHYAYHSSDIAYGLIAISWPLIFFGIAIFIIGFVQIYWAKFTGKGAVAVGLYRWIRHPQYLALAIIGLGATIYWSRFIILISYVTMLFLYYLLARFEETRCLEKFGDSYQDYLDKTARFLPFNKSTNGPPISIAQRSGIYLLTLGLSIGGGFGLRSHVAGQVLSIHHTTYSVIALAPYEQLASLPEKIDNNLLIQTQLKKINAVEMLVYLAPAQWSVPEIGLSDSYSTAKANTNSSRDELRNPSHHGSSMNFDTGHWTILFTGIKRSNHNGGADKQRLLDSLSITPLFSASLLNGEITELDLNPASSHWQGIPVPLYWGLRINIMKIETIRQKLLPPTLFLICLGLSVSLQNLGSFGIGLAFFIVSNLWFIPFEEVMCQQEFGEDYQKYTQKVRRWL